LLFLAGFGLGCICILTIIIARDFGHLRVGKAFIAILLAGACFLIEPLLPEFLAKFCRDFYTMVPALFWLLCQLAFAHRPNILSPSGLAALYSFLAPMFSNHLNINDSDPDLVVLIGWTLPAYTEYLMIALGLWTVVSNWSDDLVESSRRLRGVVLIGVGLSVLLVIVPMNTGIVGRFVPYMSICVVTLACAYFLLQGQQGVLFGIQASIADDEQAPMTPTHSADIIALNQLMDSGFYRTEHLTLKMLADALALPEYKTRQLINQTMGYRNFNDYINQLRIEEACARLMNEPDTPILNISLDVGYRTLSSFNRAFKEIKSVPPSVFRQQKTTVKP